MRKQPTSMLRAVFVTAFAVILTWQVTTRSLVAYLASTAPETALSLSSNDPRALLNLAETKLTSSRATGEPRQLGGGAPPPDEKTGEPLRLWSELAAKTAQVNPATSDPPFLSPEIRELIREWTELALLGDPLNARALTTLGRLAHDGGDASAAETFFRAAADRSIRERVAVYWLMHKSYEDRDYAAAINRADTLLRTRSQAAPYVMPLLMEMAENKDANAEVTKALLNNPPWRSTFLSALGQGATDPRTTLELLLAIRTTSAPPTTEDVRNYVKALIGRKQHELAYYVWLEFLSPEQLSGTGLVFNGSFELNPSGVPFDWVIGEGAGVTADIVEHPDREGQRALVIEFGYGRVDFPGVEQLTMLAPGSYQFKANHKGELLAKRGLVWRITCADVPNALLAESAMAMGAIPKWKDIEFVFTVPATGCRMQQMRLQLDARMASEQLVSGSMWYDDVRIVRTYSTSR